MSKEEVKVRRTLQLRFTMPTADSAQFAAMIKAATPFYSIFGKAQVRLLQNVDDPAKFVSSSNTKRRRIGSSTASASPPMRACRPISRPGAPCFPAHSKSTSIRKFRQEI